MVLPPLSSEQKLLAGAVLALGGVLTLAHSPLIPWICRKALGGLARAFRGRGPRQDSVEIAGIRVRDDARLRHTQIVGATGTGKTVLLEHLIYQDLMRGRGALIIDPKGDRDFYDRLKQFCQRIGRAGDLHFLSASHLRESCRWNPCRLGSASELQTKWYQSGVYQEPFYAKACEQGLLRAFTALTLEKRDGFTLSDLVSKINQLSETEKDARSHLQGLSYEIYNIAQSEWGQILCATHPSHINREISLLEITRKNEILFVDLPTEAKAVQSARLGKLLLQEMMLISGLRKIYPHLRTERPFSIYVDEFDAFATENFVTFLNKGRSSQFMIHIAHQTLSDLNRISADFLGQVMGNCAVRFIFRQDYPDDAETWSRFLGTVETTKRTYQTENGVSTGRSSNRDVREFRVSPDEIKNLRVGECVFSEKVGRQIRKLRLPFPVKVPIAPELPAERGATRVDWNRKPSLSEAQNRLTEFIEENQKIAADS